MLWLWLYSTAGAGQEDHLGHQGGGGGALILPGGWEDTLGLVVPGQSVDSALDQNETKLCVLILPVTLQMFPDGYSLLDKVVAILWQFWGHSLSFQDTQDLVASDEPDLGHTMAIPENDTNLGRSQTFLSKLENLVLDLL